MTRSRNGLLVAIAVVSLAPAARGASPGDVVLVPAVAKAPGAAGAQWESTVWITNTSRSGTMATLEYQARGGGIAVAPPRWVGAGATLTLADVVGTVFGLDGAGALLVRADQPLLVTSRTFHRPAAGADADSRGAALAGVPSGSWLRAGDTATLQGLPSDTTAFRYNVGLVEAAGGNVTARVALVDESGLEIERLTRLLGPGEVLQANVSDLFPHAGSRIGSLVKVDVVGGDGALVLYGTQIANVSQDATAFEMTGPEGQRFDRRRELEGTTSSRLVPLILAAAREGYATATAPLSTPGINSWFDDEKKTWHVYGEWESGAHVELEIDLWAAPTPGLGEKQKFFDPATTTRMNLRGTVANDGALVRLDVVLYDVEPAKASRGMTGTFDFRTQGIEKRPQFAASLSLTFDARSWRPVGGRIAYKMELVETTVQFNP